MNQQHYLGGGLTPISSEPLKRRRGRPRKDESLAHAAKLTPIKPPTALGTQVFMIKQTHEAQSCVQPQADVSKGKARVEDANPDGGGGVKDDFMIGQAVTGVLEGMFDAGYFLSVRVGESDTRLKGLVFQPGKFVPVTTDNDIAPRAKMYSRVDVQSPAQACDSMISSSKLVQPVHYERQVVGATVDPVPFILQSTPENDPIAIAPEKIMVEKSGLVPMGCENKANDDVAKEGLEHSISQEPSEVFMECEGFVGKEGGSNVVMEAAKGDGENVAAIPKKHFGSPSLELALSSSSFGDTQVPTDVSKPAEDEGQQNIPLQNLDPSLASSIMKDVLKISIDVDKEEKTHVGASFGFLEEIESGREDVMLDPVAKKPKIDEKMYSSEVASSESVLQPEGITAPKELVDSQGFNYLACLNKPMDTD